MGESCWPLKVRVNEHRVNVQRVTLLDQGWLSMCGRGNIRFYGRKQTLLIKIGSNEDLRKLFLLVQIIIELVKLTAKF